VCVKCYCCVFIASCRWHPALLCDTAVCVKFHYCLFITSCRWHPALLCDTAVCVKCYCCLFIASCRWHPALLCDTAVCVWSATTVCSLLPARGTLYCCVIQQSAWITTAVCSLRSAGGTHDVSVLTSQPSVAPLNQTNPLFHKLSCSPTRFCFWKITTVPHFLADVIKICGWQESNLTIYILELISEIYERIPAAHVTDHCVVWL
jgi:hypothetical protein